MNARRIIPAKFFAVFSKREKIRRFSLSQPINRSTTLRRRYASASNSTPRLSRSSLVRLGMTGWIPRSFKYSSTQSARYPLSPAIISGQGIATPSLSNRSSSAPQRSFSSDFVSCDWPGDKTKCSGKPKASQRTLIFVEYPPRERPNAWSSGSSGSFFFPATRAASGGPNDGSIDTPQVARKLFGINECVLEAGQNLLKKPV